MQAGPLSSRCQLLPGNRQPCCDGSKLQRQRPVQVNSMVSKLRLMCRHTSSHSSKIAAPSDHSSFPSRAQSSSRTTQQTCPAVQQQQELNQQLPRMLTSLLAAAAVTVSSCLAPETALLGPGAAAAQARMTPDERVTIEIFKKSTPSVVNVTNLTARSGSGQAVVASWPFQPQQMHCRVLAADPDITSTNSSNDS